MSSSFINGGPVYSLPSRMPVCWRCWQVTGHLQRKRCLSCITREMPYDEQRDGPPEAFGR